MDGTRDARCAASTCPMNALPMRACAPAPLRPCIMAPQSAAATSPACICPSNSRPCMPACARPCARHGSPHTGQRHHQPAVQQGQPHAAEPQHRRDAQDLGPAQVRASGRGWGPCRVGVGVRGETACWRASGTSSRDGLHMSHVCTCLCTYVRSYIPTCVLVLVCDYLTCACPSPPSALLPPPLHPLHPLHPPTPPPHASPTHPTTTRPGPPSTGSRRLWRCTPACRAPTATRAPCSAPTSRSCSRAPLRRAATVRAVPPLPPLPRPRFISGLGLCDVGSSGGGFGRGVGLWDGGLSFWGPLPPLLGGARQGGWW